jgi:hypothetical protein
MRKPHQVHRKPGFSRRYGGEMVLVSAAEALTALAAPVRVCGPAVFSKKFAGA